MLRHSNIAYGLLLGAVALLPGRDVRADAFFTHLEETSTLDGEQGFGGGVSVEEPLGGDGHGGAAGGDGGEGGEGSVEELEVGYCETSSVWIEDLGYDFITWQECCVNMDLLAECTVYVDEDPALAEGDEGEGEGGDEGMWPALWGTWVFPFGAHSDDKKKDPKLTLVPKPSATLPDPWAHPPSTKMDGKCGLTAVSNMARFYGVEKDPKDIDKPEFRSVGPGLRRDKLAEDVASVTGKKCDSKNIPAGTDPLQTLRDLIDAGKPVAIQYMMGATTAHWVVVTAVKDTPNGVVLVVQSWGDWYEVAWSEIGPQWKRGYGGDYPYVVCEDASPKLPVKPPPKK
jgi:hypothetical protein